MLLGFLAQLRSFYDMKHATTALLLLFGAGLARADFSFEHNEHTYKVVTTPATWTAAQAAASDMQLNGESGYLVVIDSAEENEAIISALQAQLSSSDFDNTRAEDGGDAAYLWIGASDAISEGVWLWDNTQQQFWAGDFNGSPVNGLYNNWGVEPDNAGNQDAAGIGLEAWPTDFGDLGIGGQWNDLDTNNSLYYIVEFDTPAATFALSLEEPSSGQIYSGIGNLRGWALSSESVDRVEVYIDGNFAYNAPYGGPRGDVANAFPDVDGARQSGFSLAFSYSNLGFGEHTIMVRAVDGFGSVIERSATFDVVAFHKPFIAPADTVDFSQAIMTPEGDAIRVQNAQIDGVFYDLLMKWRPAEQGLEIIEIDQLTSAP